MVVTFVSPMGSIVTRAILMVAGYAYPAYECYKGVERGRPDVESLRFWCQYWMIIALLTIFERLGENLVSWLPMYNEAKLAFVIYLWCPKTMGATYIYGTFLKPYVSRNEPAIDRHLSEFKTRAGDLAYTYWQRGAIYVQARFFELLHFLASQTPAPPVVTEDAASARPPPEEEELDYDIVEAEPEVSVPQGYQQPAPNTRRRASSIW